MLLYLSDLSDYFSPLNVFRYVSFRVVMAVITALLLSLLYPSFIKKLVEKQVGQIVRDDGPQSHLKKRGTPTMGGSLILFSIVISSLLWADLSNHYVWIALVLTSFFGGIGFIDDYLKIREKGSRGLPGKWKLILQFGISAILMYVLFNDPTLHYNPTLYFPFVSVDTFSLSLHPILYAIFSMIVIVGTSNAVNLTDGLDGLAITPVSVAAGTFLILCYVAGTVFQIPVTTENGQTIMAAFDMAQYLKIPSVEGVAELSVFAGAIVGSGIGFLWFNSYPAQVFMGDLGSLSLGGALGTLAVLSKNEFLSVIICGLFVIEAVSVITQREYFKLTHKRIFRMAPIHHHFELAGWAEPKVIVRFWIISIMFALIALSSLKLR